MQNVKIYFEQNRVEHEKFKRYNLKFLGVYLPENVAVKFDLTCNECGCVFLSRPGIKKSPKTLHVDRSYLL